VSRRRALVVAEQCALPLRAGGFAVGPGERHDRCVHYDRCMRAWFRVDTNTQGHCPTDCDSHAEYDVAAESILQRRAALKLLFQPGKKNR
jgi:hypothetical protein